MAVDLTPTRPPRPRSSVTRPRHRTARPRHPATRDLAHRTVRWRTGLRAPDCSDCARICSAHRSTSTACTGPLRAPDFSVGHVTSLPSPGLGHLTARIARTALSGEFPATWPLLDRGRPRPNPHPTVAVHPTSGPRSARRRPRHRTVGHSSPHRTVGQPPGDFSPPRHPTTVTMRLRPYSFMSPYSCWRTGPLRLPRPRHVTVRSATDLAFLTRPRLPLAHLTATSPGAPCSFTWLIHAWRFLLISPSPDGHL